LVIFAASLPVHAMPVVVHSSKRLGAKQALASNQG
jgi:hypothetical protein